MYGRDWDTILLELSEQEYGFQKNQNSGKKTSRMKSASMGKRTRKKKIQRTVRRKKRTRSDEKINNTLGLGE